MKAEISATNVTITLELTQRELELLHELMRHLTGFQGEELSQVPGSAEEFTAITHALSSATAPQVRLVQSRTGEQRSNPIVTEKFPPLRTQ